MTGYLIDILLPINTCLLGQLLLRKIFSTKNSRMIASLCTFAFGALVEYFQYKGLDFLGATYDLWDLAMYALGIFMGFGIDSLILYPWEIDARASLSTDGKLP